MNCKNNYMEKYNIIKSVRYLSDMTCSSFYHSLNNNDNKQSDKN